MAARYIIFTVGIIFLALGLFRSVGAGWRHPQAKAWLLVGGIFLAVSVYLFVWQG